MLNQIMGVLECEVCGSGLVLDESATIDDYSLMRNANSLNFTDKIDEIINKYLVYSCTVCKSKFKYTYKDLEKSLRKKITEKVLMLVVKGQIDTYFSFEDGFLVYCGKCKGLDGQGSCTKTIYKKCEIKRFPLNEL
jgi:hypothetical protein